MTKFTDHLGRPIVAVTGIGIVSSLGRGKTDNWAALTSGKSGIHSITRFPTDLLNTRIAGTVDFMAESNLGASVLSYGLAAAAAEEAIAESDAVVLTTEWSEYRDLDWTALAATVIR